METINLAPIKVLTDEERKKLNKQKGFLSRAKDKAVEKILRPLFEDMAEEVIGNIVAYMENDLQQSETKKALMITYRPEKDGLQKMVIIKIVKSDKEMNMKVIKTYTINISDLIQMKIPQEIFEDIKTLVNN